MDKTGLEDSSTKAKSRTVGTFNQLCDSQNSHLGENETFTGINTDVDLFSLNTPTLPLS